jgi:hypothetical protein
MGVLGHGLLAGAAAMTLAETIGQALTGRPDSHVPAHTLEPLGLDRAMHRGRGIAPGAVRAPMAERDIRGPEPSA